MDLRRLRYFVAVAEELHFGRAAEKVHVVPSAVSHQIKMLEEELEFALFDRIRQKVTLTPLGEAFLPEAKAILLRAQQGIERARASAAGTVGSLTVGFVDSALWSVLPSILQTFRVQYPLISLKLMQLDRMALIAALRSSSIDIAIMPAPTPSADEVDSFLLTSAPLVVALPPEHRLSGNLKISLRELMNEPFVLFPTQMRTRLLEMVVNACSAAGFEPNVAQEAEQLHTLMALVRAGLGVTIAPMWMVQAYNTGLSYAMLSDPIPNYELVMAWRHDQTNPAVKRFCSASAFADSRDIRPSVFGPG
jgi:DNA-binding transcriptional LysR family regulator